MFCIHCGKNIADNASFCAYCGKPIQGEKQPQKNDWEYVFYRKWWKPGKGGRYNLINGKSEYSVRLELWGTDEGQVIKELQEFYDIGWQPLTPPGPSCYRFSENTAYSGDYNYKWLEIRLFIVELRRPAQERTAMEKEVIGVWQETDDPNQGFWNKFGNVLLSQRLEVERAKMEFHKDKTFTVTNRDGTKGSGGIFGEADGKIAILYKYTPELDTIATIEGDKLSYKSQHGNLIELERAR